MLGIYFSGTGNTRYCIEQFIKKMDSLAECLSIEDKGLMDKIVMEDLIIIAYPIYFSNLPKIVRDFIVQNQSAFADKKVFIIATMGLFSGDGTGCCARILTKAGAKVIGGIHLKMPDCIGDEKVLKKSIQQNNLLVKQAELKISDVVRDIKNGSIPQEGLGFLYHMAGLFGQRLWFYNKTKEYSKKLKVDVDKCVGCGRCVKLCPMDNLALVNKKVSTHGKCTMCYRCINHCPHQALTLLGKKVHEQCYIEKYL